MKYDSDGQHRGAALPRGPYGTNEGDLWTIPGSELQNIADRAGEGLIVIVEMKVFEGVLQECMYSVKADNPDPEIRDLIEQATKGHELYVAALAGRN
jgi:hypothetical protein